MVVVVVVVAAASPTSDFRIPWMIFLCFHPTSDPEEVYTSPCGHGLIQCHLGPSKLIIFTINVYPALIRVVKNFERSF